MMVRFCADQLAAPTGRFRACWWRTLGLCRRGGPFLPQRNLAAAPFTSHSQFWACPPSLGEHGCHLRGECGTCFVKDLWSGRSIFPPLSRDQCVMTALGKPEDSRIVKCGCFLCHFSGWSLLPRSAVTKTVSSSSLAGRVNRGW